MVMDRPSQAELSGAPAEPIRPRVSLTWQGAVFLAWVVAVLTMIALLIYRSFYVRRLIEQAEPANDSLRAVLDQAFMKMRVNRRIALKLSAEAVSPAVCGLFRPCIVIPRGLPDELDHQHLQSILLHELAHIRRGDLWINSIQAVLQIIYIYHPLLWLANAVIRNIREQAVDEMVLVALGDQAEFYPKTLLTISRLTFGNAGLSLRMIGVVESKKALFDRIDHITSQPFPRNVRLGISGLLVIAILGAALLPMARAQKAAEENSVIAQEKVQEKVQESPVTLFQAVEDGNLERIKVLIAQGADVMVRNEKGATPLHRAAWNNHFAVVKLLLENNADINAPL